MTLGAIAGVLHCLGLEKDLAKIAQDDVLGRKLQDIGLPTRVRAPRRSSQIEKRAGSMALPFKGVKK